jgi:hypothetical protein
MQPGLQIYFRRGAQRRTAHKISRGATQRHDKKNGAGVDAFGALNVI